MKAVLALFIAFAGLTAAFGQNEQSPIVEKDIEYSNWSYRSVRDSEIASLRDLAAGKKLVVVVYFAPWCPNWRHDAPMVQRLYDKYKANGLEVVGVSEYDTAPMAKANIDQFKLTFPIVYESEGRDQRSATTHSRYRRSTGDTRNWGSPWYIFLEPARFEKGDVLVKRTSVINGEMIEAEGEKFIREKLGMPAAEASKLTSMSKKETEPCDPEKPSAGLKRP
jgi:thiol-disulfide isomerase/thioredoxin